MQKILILTIFALAVTLAPATATSPERQDYDTLVNRYYAQFQQPGFTIDDLLEYYSPDIDFRDPTFDITIRGETEFRGLYSGLGTDRTGYTDIEWTLDDVVIDDDRVVIAGRWAGRFHGCPFDIEFMTLWGMRDGVIAYQRDFFAASAFDEQVRWNAEERRPQCEPGQSPE